MAIGCSEFSLQSKEEREKNKGRQCGCEAFDVFLYSCSVIISDVNCKVQKNKHTFLIG